MKTNLKKLLALLLVVVMVAALFAGCKTKNNPTATTAAPDASGENPGKDDKPGGEEEVKVPDTRLVYATSAFDQKFSPFFYTTAYDGEVVDMVHGYLLTGDRGGAILQEAMGDEGMNITYDGTEYNYRTMGNVEVVRNADGTVDYNLTMRNDIVFSDGTPATIDDVIFGIYVMCDPTYDGNSTIYALPIEGMAAYRSGMDTMFNLMLAAGRENTDFTNWTEEEQNTFWAKMDAAGEAFAKSICDYCVANYADDYAEAYIGATADDVRADEALQVKLGMFLWGYDGAWAEGATFADYWAAIVEAYGGDIMAASDAEKAGSDTIPALFEGYDDYTKGIATGEGAPNITGIKKTGDYTMTVHMTAFDATAIYNMGFTVAPMHYYGEKAKYDYDNNKFGFDKGDLSHVKSVTAKPMGCGPYVYDGYNNGTVSLTANTKYYKGCPKVGHLYFQEGIDADYVPGIQSGSFDIASPSINDDTLKAIKDANSNGEIVGDTITTVLVDYRGYGYLGINADLVNVNGEPGSDASKALRKGFMTLLAVHRDTVINSYYGDRAAVIQYPISNTSWAAPKPADEGYRTAYSVDVDGNPIYDSSMSEEQKYEAAKQAAIGYFKAAGFAYDEATGTFDTGDQTWEIMIPGQGIQDHPAYGVAVAASETLKEMGITLQVNDVGTSTWSAALNGNTAMMWAAAWQASVDPDMTQVYHSSNAHGNGTNSNHYAVDDANLDKLIVEGRSSDDTEYRKAIYKSAMEIIMDWGCELPLYQRKDCTCFSTQRVNIDTIPGNMTPFWGWAAEIEKLEAK